MAQKTVVTLIDDLDGQQANETITFALDGVSYEIDLGKVNADKLRTALRPFQAAARKTATATSRGRTGRGSHTTRTDRERSADIRAWAKQHGLQVSERGRIAATVVAAYQADDPTQLTGPTPS
jgi:hypothetical protein